MKRASRLLARLYPAPWRRRYGPEFDALLDDHSPTFRSLANVLFGAVKMRLTLWNFMRIVAATAALGALAAFAGSYTIPKSYRSTATFRIAGLDDDRLAYDSLTSLLLTTLSRARLTSIILNLSLYPERQAPSELQQTIENMRKHIRVSPTSAREVSIEFDYPNPVMAQYTVQRLTTTLLDASIDMARGASERWRIDLREPASLSRNPVSPNRLNLAATGLGAGTAIGALLGLLTFHFGRIVTAAALIGALAGAAASFAIPKTYRSTALVRILAPDDQVKSAIENVMAGNSPATAKTFRLQAVQGVQPPTFMIQFDDHDPVAAQRELGEVIDRFGRAAPQTLRVIEPAVFPSDAVSPNRSAFAGWGLLAGIGTGVLLIIFRRNAGGSRRLHSTPDGTS